MASFSRDRDTNIGAVEARRTCLASPLPALRVQPTRRGVTRARGPHRGRQPRFAPECKPVCWRAYERRASKDGD